MSWFSRERRDPCFGLCVASVACVGLLMEIALYFRSGATRKSDGAVSGRCRKTMERSGARSGGSRSGNGAGSGDHRIRLERGAAFSPAPLRSHALSMEERICRRAKSLRLKRLKRYGYTTDYLTFSDLLDKADSDLFCNMRRSYHCLHHVLPPLRMVDNLRVRVRGHPYILP